MKIYFAGFTFYPEGEKNLIKFKTNRLFSFYHHGENKSFYHEFKERIQSIKEGNKDVLSSSRT